MEKKEIRIKGGENDKFFIGEKEISMDEFAEVMAKRFREDGALPFDGVVCYPDMEGDEERWVIEDGKQESKYGPVGFFCTDRLVSKDEFIEEVFKSAGVKPEEEEGYTIGIEGVKMAVSVKEGVTITFNSKRARVIDEQQDGEKEEGR